MSMPYHSRALAQVLSTIAEEGVEDPREQILLWIVRNQFALAPADSYASILNDREILPGVLVDAVAVVSSRDITTSVYILFEESTAELKGRATRLSAALSAESSPESRLSQENKQLRALFEPVLDRDAGSDLARLILCVCMEAVKGPTRAAIARAAVGDIEVQVIDPAFISALVEAELSPTEAIEEVRLPVDPSRVLDLGMRQGEAIIVPVSATAIAKLPGIENRTLFDLNVRHALGMNRVRKSLDAALRDDKTADAFIAYHNGITAVCREFAIVDGTLIVSGMSVVNGAQSVVAMAANADHLSSGIRVLLKLVRADPQSELARNIAIRSNTQNPVTSRNLRALDDVQARLQRDLAELGYAYLRRPNDGTPSGHRVIRNDDVAQLLCSIYARRPALAVKRQALFEIPLYDEIFPADLSAGRVIFADSLRRVIEELKDAFPIRYRRAWALTALTAVNMTAEAMRRDGEGSSLLVRPEQQLAERDSWPLTIRPFALAASAALHDRIERFERHGREDDFKVAFKQTRTLTDLALQASRELSRRSDEEE